MIARMTVMASRLGTMSEAKLIADVPVSDEVSVGPNPSEHRIEEVLSTAQPKHRRWLMDQIKAQSDAGMKIVSFVRDPTDKSHPTVSSPKVGIPESRDGMQDLDELRTRAKACKEMTRERLAGFGEH